MCIIWMLQDQYSLSSINNIFFPLCPLTDFSFIYLSIYLCLFILLINILLIENICIIINNNIIYNNNKRNVTNISFGNSHYATNDI